MFLYLFMFFILFSFLPVPFIENLFPYSLDLGSNIHITDHKWSVTYKKLKTCRSNMSKDISETANKGTPTKLKFLLQVLGKIRTKQKYKEYKIEHFRGKWASIPTLINKNSLFLFFILILILIHSFFINIIHFKNERTQVKSPRWHISALG